MDDTSFLPADAALRGYLDAIQPSPELFLTYYDFLPDKSVAVTTWTRATFWDFTMRAVALIQRVVPPTAGGSGEGFLKGQRMVHYVSGNLAEDVALRLASVFLGTVPVTINWQADIEAQIHYKITSTDAKVVFVDKRTPDVDKLRAAFPGVPIVNVDDIHTTAPVSNADLVAHLRAAAAGGMLPTVDDVRCIIFTSGTTGATKRTQTPTIPQLRSVLLTPTSPPLSAPAPPSACVQGTPRAWSCPTPTTRATDALLRYAMQHNATRCHQRAIATLARPALTSSSCSLPPLRTAASRSSIWR